MAPAKTAPVSRLTQIQKKGASYAETKWFAEYYWGTHAENSYISSQTEGS